ncbi:AraC family transcriptional regulator [Pseudomonas sp. HMWF032]|uniref:AraC family transcriptional regulator n=1 Tax=unclassified Pseudomonas TaxID=196821 RepID=UPI000D399B3F|nr:MULTISPECIES: AraC family transcriptional regulator [unclassified Pseudomonas]PTS84828.1 AraC family transcriptional regulator [Pseudomonas sp. HMWF032]PTT84400.1 AraC family transcriptional regulator [Pseudomonas sp. HMWF010]WAC46272.1 AraC family transcriptional regulator [Pseudomonas sp. SL4(2022)]
MLHAHLTTLHVVSLILEVFSTQPELTQQLLADSGIASADLACADTRITRTQELKVCANALQLRRDLGLELGRRMHVSAYGMVGYAALSSATFGDAWRLLLQYPALLGTYFKLDLQIEGQLAWVSASEYQHSTELEVFNLEMCLASLKLTSDDLLGQNLPLSAAQFSFAEPDYSARYTRSFACPLQFNAPRNAFAFPARWLQEPLPLADAVTHREMLARCRKQNSEFYTRQAWLERVRQLLASQLPTPPGLEQLAQQMHCSPRTLRRHLQELGTHYQELLDELRFEQAKTLLGQEDWPICRIAEHLGFSETASFRHAFQRWSGVAPSRFRA